MYQLYIKRILDIFISILGILVLCWLYILIALIIKLTSRGPVFFKQRRIGIHKSEFMILKFRTMRIDAPKDMPTHLLMNPDSFITPIGKFLRKTSLDELPQLFNILCGQMSIVGPRPALWNQKDLIRERDKYGANDISPGLTGLAQIKGRDELPITVKAKFDGEYTRHVTFLTDIKIFTATILKVLKQDGIKEGNGKNEKNQF